MAVNSVHFDDPVLRRMKAALREGRPQAPEDAKTLILELDAGNLGNLPGTRVRRRREIIAALCANRQAPSAKALARSIAQELERYAATGYARDIAERARPLGERGLMHDALALFDGKALGRDAIYDILRNRTR